MAKRIYLATAIALIAVIGLILSCSLSFFSDTEASYGNTFTAGVSESCTGETCYGANLWWIGPICTGGCGCDIYDHITGVEQCRSDCAEPNNCDVMCNGAECDCYSYQVCLVDCLNMNSEMASCKLIDDEGKCPRAYKLIQCTCYCDWGGEP